MSVLSEQEQIDALRRAGVDERTISLLREKTVLSSNILKNMGEDDLKEIGISDLIERKKLVGFIEDMRAAQAAPSPAVHKVLTARVRKSKWVAFFLWLFLGAFGAHRFYCGRNGSAAAQLILSLLGWLTYGLGIGVILLLVVGIWLVVDVFIVLFGQMTMGQEDRLQVRFSSTDEV